MNHAEQQATSHVGGAGECTVVVVSYRHEDFIDQCLDSLLAQTVASRILLFDNASPDETLGRARAWNARHDGLIEIHAGTENLGICARLNEALALVETEFFAYVSTDDFWEPTHLEDSLTSFASSGTDCVCVYGDAYQCDREGTRLPALCSDVVPVPAHHSGWVFRELVAANWIPTPSVVLRTAAVRAAGCYDPALRYEDYDLWLRLARIGTMSRLERPTSTARQVAGTSLTAELMGARRTAFLEDVVRILSKHVERGGDDNALLAEQLLPKLRLLVLAGAARPVTLDALARLRRARVALPKTLLYTVIAATGSGPLLARVRPPTPSARRA